MCISYLEKVYLDIGQPGRARMEPSLQIHIQLFNGTVFTLAQQNAVFVAYYDGQKLALAPTMQQSPVIIGPGSQRLLSFTQPIQEATAKHLQETVERHDRVRWTVNLTVDFLVEEAGITYKYDKNNLEKEEIPFSRG